MKLKHLLTPFVVIFILSTNSLYAEEASMVSAKKGKTYFLEDASVILKIKRIGGDKKMKWRSQQELNTAFNKYLRESFKAANMLAEKPEDAHAHINVSMKFTRTFVAFTNRRMNPIIRYNILGFKGDKEFFKYSSGKLINTRKMYNKKSKTQELDVLAYFADQVVEKTKENDK